MKKKIIEYKMVIDLLDFITDSVNAEIINGWQPYGQLCMIDTYRAVQPYGQI